MNCNKKRCCTTCCKNCNCHFPKSLLAPVKKQTAPEVLKLKNYLALPFPEDDI